MPMHLQLFVIVANIFVKQLIVGLIFAILDICMFYVQLNCLTIRSSYDIVARMNFYPIISLLFSILLASYYSQNKTGKLASPLLLAESHHHQTAVI